MKETILRVKNLTKKIENAVILKNISFELKKDEIISIIGPSGVGKTLLLRILAGLDSHSSGNISFFQPKDSERDLTTLVFEEPTLIPWLTIFDNIYIALEHLNIDEREKISRVKFYLELTGLSGYEDEYPIELTKGLQKKASLARAMAVEPIILLLDEPFSNIDVLSAQALKDELIKIIEDKDYPTEGTIFSTHNVEDAVYLADKVVVLDGKPGHIKETIKIDLKRPRNKKSKKFNKCIDNIYELLLR